jgi:bifunctional non-homologous end joining protein LigD
LLELSSATTAYELPDGPPLYSQVGCQPIALDEPASLEAVLKRFADGGRIWDQGEIHLTSRKQSQIAADFFGTHLSGEYVLSHSAGFLSPAGRGIEKRNLSANVAAGARQFEPMLCASQEYAPFDDAGWSFEIKWDGIRALCFYSQSGPEFRSRSGRDITASYPELSEIGKYLCAADCVVDGEIVVLDERGVSDFGRLQLRPSQRASDAQALCVYYAFDLLACDGEDLTALPLASRRQRLVSILEKDERVRLSESVVGEGISLFEAASEAGCEGLIAKRTTSAYLPGKRSENWRKIKALKTGEFAIAGFTSGTGSRTKSFGSLLLAEGDREPYRYVGAVGTGFTDAALSDIAKQLRGLARPSAPFDNPPRLKARATWCEPSLRCEVEYARKTHNGILRAARFKRLLDAPTDPISNPNKLFWPEASITKQDLVSYYRQIARYILPHLSARPIVMNRFPDGWQGESFYQKNVPDHRPSWLQTVSVSHRGHEPINYVLCPDTRHLAWLANAGCIEMHPWLSQTPDLDSPTQVLFDLDPNPPAGFSESVAVALLLKDTLDSLGLLSFAKTSGGAGIHVMVPVRQGLSFEFVRLFAQGVASVIERGNRELVTTEYGKQRRGARVLIDFRQNRRGSTIASVYSARPYFGAPVSTPLRWDELDGSLDPAAFTFDVVLERAARFGDLFEGVLQKPQSVEPAVGLLSEMLA